MLPALASVLLAIVVAAGAPRPAPVAAAAPLATAGDSARSDAEVRASVLRNTSDIRRCYESEGLPRNPALTGRLRLVLTIQPTGIVSDVRADSSTLAGPGALEVARCVAVHARNWRFERGDFETETHAFPLDFVPEMVKPIAGGKRGA